MINKMYFAALLAATVGLAVIWFPSLWFMNKTLQTENVYQDYVKRNILKQLHDKCQDGELIWVLRELKRTDNVQNLNRSEIRAKILEVQLQQMSQWEFATDDDRSISPSINKICKQNYDTIIDELETNCTIQELHKICDYLNAEKREPSSSISKLNLADDIVDVKRIRIDLNVTKLIDKFCIEKNLGVIALELMESCSGGRIKKMFIKLNHIQKNGGNVVSCNDCVEKNDFVEAVIEVKRQHYHQTRMEPLLDEFCIQPEVKSLKWKLMDSCSVDQIKQILNELDDKLPCDHCVEKDDYIDALVNAKRRQFSKVNVNTLITKMCPELSLK